MNSATCFVAAETNAGLRPVLVAVDPGFPIVNVPLAVCVETAGVTPGKLLVPPPRLQAIAETHSAINETTRTGRIPNEPLRRVFWTELIIVHLPTISQNGPGTTHGANILNPW
jgi:hypothetical protein